MSDIVEKPKYYWLKLKRDFFKRHDIRIIEGMENGKDYVLFYLKLLLESIDHDGSLRFSDTIPYNDKMLATITGTNIDIVRSAIKLFTELNMMDQLDDGTLYMNQVEQMTGNETKWAEKKRIYRKNNTEIGQKEDNVLSVSSQCPNSVPSLSDKSKRIELEIEIRDRENNKQDSANNFSDDQFSDPEPEEDQFADPEPEENPVRPPRSVYNPNDISGAFETVRKHWNSKPGLPAFSRLFLNLFPEERDIFTKMLIHGMSEICKGIDNYATACGDPKKYGFDVKYAYKSFPGFLKAVEKWLDSAKPLSGKQGKIENDNSKYDALMRVQE